jgi:murein DD-endopeptidase MepM/ murein hydrolase activator NlpD
MVPTILLALCLALPPVDGPMVRGFSPTSEYAGHWGVDIAAPSGSDVLAPDGGVVTFAGTVAGTSSVTIRVAQDVRVSLSYLSSIDVGAGSSVAAGTIVGRSGLAHGDPAVHVSVRIGDEYVDPINWLQCRRGTIRLLADR